jgi:deoxyribonuclease IV
MFIGAHVSPAGGPAKAVARGEALGARAIQIFNQSPRAWRWRDYDDEAITAFHAAMAAGDVDVLLIHAIYLLNCASEDPQIVEKSRSSLTASLRAGAALGAHAVVLHPGSALGGEVGPAIARAGRVIGEALAQSGDCPLHLENTAGSGGTLGRSFEELGALIEAAGGDDRLGLCLDSCHLLASGYDIRTPAGLDDALTQCDAAVGLGRLGSLHLNDSQTPLGSNVDRHADPGEGHLGREGCAAFLSEPRFEDLPCVLELNGPEKKDIDLARELRAEGAATRRGAG